MLSFIGLACMYTTWHYQGIEIRYILQDIGLKLILQTLIQPYSIIQHNNMYFLVVNRWVMND